MVLLKKICVCRKLNRIDMKFNLQLVILLCVIGFHVNAQPFMVTGPKLGLNIGDTVPPLKIKTWIKGEPVKNFEKGKIYIVEFWATWCVPCMLSMPHLSELKRKYKDQVTVMAVDIYEKPTTPLKEIKKLVDSMGNRMDFPVGIDQDNFMAKNWVDTSEARAIPRAFIVNDRKIEWIGHPMYLDSVLMRVLDKTWNREFALLKRNHGLYLDHLEFMAARELVRKIERYVVNIPRNMYDRVRVPPDSVLMVIDEIVKDIPSLKFTSTFAAFTFEALLKTDVQKAYEYIREAMAVTDGPPYSVLISKIEGNTENLQIPKDIYMLGAECYQALNDNDPYPEFGLPSGRYQKMAKLYRLAGDLAKAEEAEQKSKSIITDSKSSIPKLKEL